MLKRFVQPIQGCASSKSIHGATMTRPSFHAAWAAAKRIYIPSNSLAHVAHTIGGQVKHNILDIEPKLRWRNTCAVRISYVLNQTGTSIPFVRGQTVSGADGRWYFFRIGDVTTFLGKRRGKPEMVAYPPSGGGALAGRKGLVVFNISGWPDASGHATLWSGDSCYDNCYFNDPSAGYRTDNANFWSLS